FTSGDFAAAVQANAPVADSAVAGAPAAGSLRELVVADSAALPVKVGRGFDREHVLRPDIAGTIAKVRRNLADNAGFLTAVLFGLLVTFVGLSELYSNKPTAGHAISDWIGFFAWGFAIELTGITAAQAALRLAPGSSTTSQAG